MPFPTAHWFPYIEIHENNRASIGGWGLGKPHEVDTMQKHIMEGEDDELDWDQAQCSRRDGWDEGE